MKTEFDVVIDFKVKCELTENELRALDALVGYGFDNFLKSFYSGLGQHYLKPYEKDLKQLFDKIESLRPRLSEIKAQKDKLRELVKN
jgi:hypothetical protein